MKPIDHVSTIARTCGRDSLAVDGRVDIEDVVDASDDVLVRLSTPRLQAIE